MKFEVNKSYKISHGKYSCELFDLVKVSGGRYHLFSNTLGRDLWLTKKEFIAAVEAAKEQGSDAFWNQIEQQ